jgi:diphthamide biosynthesis protein 2
MTSLFSSSCNLETELNYQKKAKKFSDVWNASDLNRCIKFIREGSFSRVCLQFPDELLNYSVEIEGQLKKHVDANVYVLADTSYGSCCVDEVKFFLL